MNYIKNLTFLKKVTQQDLDLYQYAKTSILPDILSENDKISKYIRQAEVASQFFYF